MAETTAEREPPLPLAGLRVLDVATLYPAANVAAMFGDFGADVVKVEPPSGDPLRIFRGPRDRESRVWAYVGRNKRTITLDPEHPDGLPVLHRLTEVADVVTFNQPRKILERWRCTYDDIAARNPRAVVVTLNCYGDTGPYADRPGNGTVAEGFSGITHLTGEADGPPLLPSFALGDALAAVYGLVGAVIACYHRDVHHARGQHIDLTLYEPRLGLLATALAAWVPGTPAPRRNGSRVGTAAPRNVYRTSDDEWLVLSSTTDSQVGRVLQLMGRNSPDDTARYGRAVDRAEHADELDALVAEWIAARPLAEVLETLHDAAIPVAPINDMAALRADPHVRARESLAEFDFGKDDRVVVPAPAPLLRTTPGRVRWLGPGIGAHNAEVYAEWVGLSADDVANLADAGAI